jgi:predicted lipid-binding transport protein (Tim44 family)
MTLALPGPILAAGGSGSSGFGGGGGGGFGGGGGGFGGGAGGAGGGSPALFLIIAAAVLVFLVFTLMSAWHMRRRRAARAEQVRLAAAEAAEDDPAFAAERVVGDATTLFETVQRCWDARDRAALARVLGPDLFEEWRRRLDDFDARGWHNRVRMRGEPQVEYVGLVNRADDADDRVVVRITAPLEDYVETADGSVITKRGATGRLTTLREYWTLGKLDDGHWWLLSIEQDAEGTHQLDERIVATPWGDDQRLRDESVTELAVADAAWVEAVDGPDAPLHAVAGREAVDALLYAGDASRRTRLVVRGARVDHVAIERLEAAADPPAMLVAVAVRGRRYVQDRDTAAILAGSDVRDERFTVRWRLELDGPESAPWRLAGPAAHDALS